MIQKDKIEGYLAKLSLTYQEAGKGTWIVTDPDKGLVGLAVMMADPLVVLRINVMPVPRGHREKLYGELLKLNATDMVHGAYAVDGDEVIIIDTLEADTMDIEEFQASIDAIGLALAQHYRILAAFRGAA